MNTDANIIGRLNGSPVTPYRNGNVYNMFDGKKLDELELPDIKLMSKEDCKELIKFLELHQHCFSDPEIK